jgi:8-oxo-dGTP diphosphatase
MTRGEQLRRSIRAEVEVVRPHDALESDHRARALAWIDTGAELCRRAKPATPPMHLVSYFVVVDGEHVLLVDHRNAERWLPTRGHVEPGEHPRTTVTREAREELGIQARFLREVPLFVSVTETVGRTAGHVDVSLWYVLELPRTSPLRIDDAEFREARWFPYESAPFDRSDPHLQRFLTKLQRETRSEPTSW